MSNKNLQILLASRPTGMVKTSDFRMIETEIPHPAEGEVLVKQLYLSLDPAMRGWMNEGKSYVEPVELGAIMRGYGIGEVVESRSESLPVGSLCQGGFGWQNYVVTKADKVHPVPPSVPLPTVLSVLGGAGLTAYFGLLEVGKPNPGETVVVSGAAGAVGSLVGQIAKIKGCRTVGLAGSEEKCTWLKEEVGYDEAINYKTHAGDALNAALKAACPKGVDVFFDNVGGEILDAVLRRLAPKARVVICGAISQYNSEQVKGPSNYLSLLVNRARMEGFVLFDYAKRYPEGIFALMTWLAEGKLHHREDIVKGLENAPSALLRLFTGENKGKLMIEL